MIDATPLLHAYARFRSARLRRMPAADVQTAQLLRLVGKAAATRFGRDHGFDSIRSVADFQMRVPLRRFDGLWQEYWKPAFPRLQDCTWPGLIPFFAVTSGTTTGVTKHIPVSKAMIRSNTKAMLDLLTFHLLHRPRSRIFGGRNFMLGGSTALVRLNEETWSGDLSGISSKTMPPWARPFYFPPRELETIADWEERIAKMAPASLATDIRGIGGTPSWLLLFLDRLRDLKPEAGRSLAAFYPNLEILIHGGVNFAPYRAIFAEWLAGSRAETREVYPASEGFIALADRGDGEGLRLNLDHGLFFEFVPLEELDSSNPSRFWVATAEVGVNYAIVLSSCSGIWSYVIGDTVRFVDIDPPRVLITGRTTYSLSAFGEHLIGEELEQAVSTAATAIGARVTDYAAGALFPQSEGEPGRHLFIVEFIDGVPSDEGLARFATALDGHLATLNEDYKVHRARDFGMRPPLVHGAAPGTFAAWMKSRGKLGGQNKVPRVIQDPEVLRNLWRFASIP